MASSDKCRIAVLPFGSQGDHQPFVALMKELQKLGHHPQMWVTGESSKETFSKFGVDIKVLPGLEDMPSAEEALKTHDSLREALASGKAMKFIKGIGEINSKYCDRMVDGYLQLFEEFSPNLVVYTSLTIGPARFLLDKYQVPCCMAQFYPRSPSKDQFPVFLAMPKANLPFGLNVKVNYLATKKVSQPYLDAQALEKRKQHGLNPITMQDLWDMFFVDSMPKLAAFSSLVSPACPDWSKSLHMTGWWTLDQSEQVENFKPTPELNDFLNNGESKPVYMGWGSMIAGKPEDMARLATEAAKAAGVRAIVLGGWAEITPDMLPTDELKEYAKENMLFYPGQLPHEWLLPQCACSVVHGGSGTTAVALRSGMPTVITPILGDQFHWAKRVNELKVGKGFLKHFAKISAKEMGSAISECIKDEEIKRNASDLAAKLREENGAAQAAAILEPVARLSADKLWQNPFEQDSFRVAPNCWCTKRKFD